MLGLVKMKKVNKCMSDIHLEIMEGDSEGRVSDPRLVCSDIQDLFFVMELFENSDTFKNKISPNQSHKSNFDDKSRKSKPNLDLESANSQNNNQITIPYASSMVMKKETQPLIDDLSDQDNSF
jgi:hypothetical protein